MKNPLLTKLEAVAAFSDDDQRAVEAICGNTRRIDKGRDIVREGDKSEQVHFVLEGWAARYKTLADGPRQITDFLLPGDLCDIENTFLKK